MLPYASSPYIITTWITGYMTTDFLNGPGFRWGYGVFCIITPASIYHYGREFDAIGLLLITAGISLFLLPFNIYSYQKEQWKAPIIICFFFFGGLLIIAFAIWEKFFAPVKFLPDHLLTDRTVLGSCVLAGSVFVSFYCWDAYFTSFLQVVNGLTVVEQTWVSSIYTTGSCLWSIPVGLYIRRFGRFKWLCLFFGVGFTILGIFIAFAGGTIVISEQTAAMAAVEHQFIAVVLAIQYMFANIGGANLTTIYESLPAQLSYEWGSEERIAIQESYAASQKMMLIAGTATLAIAAVSVLVWHDYDVRDRKQVKGRVV
ncbi:Siderophore iron transporter mirB [Fusarium albosuccineum]|uniref:Siderophore iron transporter mirB n=1 Tax=Fusarium albosuccineum TaxID=1237068 RepID=A0A8H4PBS4_9HYPO|nr:Siderophore iron transporter mirB [Fusarium albosuccineum]